MRPPLQTDQQASAVSEETLVQQLGRLVSTKGSDLMITAAQDEIQSYQRLRRTVNATYVALESRIRLEMAHSR